MDRTVAAVTLDSSDGVDEEVMEGQTEWSVDKELNVTRLEAPRAGPSLTPASLISSV